MDLTSSKTLKLWIVIFLMAAVACLAGVVVGLIFAYDAKPYIDRFIGLLEVGGGGGTLRNVISDGVMPRVPQAVGANKDPTVAVQPPVSMALATDQAPQPPRSSLPTVTMTNVVQRPGGGLQ